MKKDKENSTQNWVMVTVIIVMFIICMLFFGYPHLRDKMQNSMGDELGNINSSFESADSVHVKQIEDSSIIK